jgi:hypothetical protein
VEWGDACVQPHTLGTLLALFPSEIKINHTGHFLTFFCQEKGNRKGEDGCEEKNEMMEEGDEWTTGRGKGKGEGKGRYSFDFNRYVGSNDAQENKNRNHGHQKKKVCGRLNCCALQECEGLCVCVSGPFFKCTSCENRYFCCEI